MGYGNVKKEHKEHGSLLNLLKKHFGKDEEDMESFDEDLGQPFKAMSVLKEKRRSRMNKAYDPSDRDYESEPDSYDEKGRDDDYYNKMDSDESDEDSECGDECQEVGEEEDGEMSIPKEQRKRMAIIVLGKKMSKPKRKEM